MDGRFAVVILTARHGTIAGLRWLLGSWVGQIASRQKWPVSRYASRGVAHRPRSPPPYGEGVSEL